MVIQDNDEEYGAPALDDVELEEPEIEGEEYESPPLFGEIMKESE